MDREQYFFYSECQKRMGLGWMQFYNFCELQDDGQIVEYTECSDKPEPSGKWVDYIKLGKGLWHHFEANPHYDPLYDPFNNGDLR